MRDKITAETLEAYIQCRTKFHLKIERELGIQSDYEVLIKANRAATEAFAYKNIDINCSLADILQDAHLGKNFNRNYLWNTYYEDDNFCLNINGIISRQKSQDGVQTALMPVIFDDPLIKRSDILLILQLYGKLLSNEFDITVSKGAIWFFNQTRRNYSLRDTSGNFSSWFEGMLSARTSSTPPPLILNHHCQVCEFRERCREKAMEEGNLSLLRGMTGNEIEKYNAKGIFNINQLSYTFRSRRPPKRSQKQTSPHYFSLQAQAIREQKIFVHGSADFRISQPRIYYDIESASGRNSPYLIGSLVETDNGCDFFPFWSDDDDISRIFARFAALIEEYPEHALLHYGSFDADTLRHAKPQLPASLTTSLEKAIARSINILSLVRSRVYFPTFSNGLKEIAGYLGATWSDPASSAIQSLVWREKWLASRDPYWKRHLIQYNREDCEGLRCVVAFLDGLKSAHKSGTLLGSSSLAFTADLARATSKRPLFGRAKFALPEFESINRCAYFDYQRDRVSARFPGRRKPNASLLKKKSALKIRISKIQKVIPRKCEICRSRNITPVRQLSRETIDLKFSSIGVKRWVVRYETSEFRCHKCGIRFTPREFPAGKTKFGWNLIAWCIYNHFASMQNISRIVVGLEELFQLNIPQPTVYRFKAYVSNRYRQFCRDAFERLMESPYLYVDETPVNLRSRKGYVWILTNGELAYYFFRNSREGTFLRDLLGDYSGVLVSDFFTAYDALECRQQKCLIHLIRDINDEMLKAPYNEELRELGTRFSQLLRQIVSTIDAYGLKRRHLTKHRSSSAKFLKWIESNSYKSMVAKKLQTRIVKYRDKLFTFLEFDDVAWNNNNAERAMKLFARYRRFADGRYTAISLQEYLIILTVYQTCEYRGLNFLKVLLERRWMETDDRSPLFVDIALHAEIAALPGYEIIASKATDSGVGAQS